MNVHPSCEKQPDVVQLCKRNSAQECKTCTHRTYSDTCKQKSYAEQCSSHYNEGTHQCRDAGGWACYEKIKMHLAKPGANSCDGGSVVQSGCETAVQIFAQEAGKSPGRPLQVGSGGSCLDGAWGQVPLGCSVQSGGDWTAHYKTGNHDTGACCIHKDYQLVCYDSGMFNLVIVYVLFFISK